MAALLIHRNRKNILKKIRLNIKKWIKNKIYRDNNKESIGLKYKKWREEENLQTDRSVRISMATLLISRNPGYIAIKYWKRNYYDSKRKTFKKIAEFRISMEALLISKNHGWHILFIYME